MLRRAALALLVCSLAAACGDNSPLPLDCDDFDDFACPQPAAPRCEGDTLIVTRPGTCAVENDAPGCTFAEVSTDCAASGQVCAAGACRAPDDPCVGVTCDDPPAPSCAGSVVTTPAATGVCDSSSGAPVCTYAPTTSDCAASNQACESGACVDPCADVTCEAPPAPACNGDELTTYDATGTCAAHQGVPGCAYTSHVTDCAATGDVCANGACVAPDDPCADITCNQAPADACDGDVATDYPTIGSCDSSSGTGVCHYTPQTQDCRAIDRVCEGALCVDPCVGVSCTTAPAPTCDAGTLTTYNWRGVCTSPGGDPACTYQPTQTSCAAQDRACDATAGACVDPCPSFTCDAPPAATCEAGVLTTYAAGVCSSPGGVPGCSFAPTALDCTAQGRVCDAAAAACVDPCIGFTCDPAPAPTCENGVLTTYAAGMCASPGGVPACTYAPTPTDCAATNQVCDASAGACVDACGPDSCATPPAPTCDGEVLVTSTGPGTCSSPAGDIECSYPSTPFDCTSIDQTCEGGACVDPCLGFTCDPPAATCEGNTLHSFAPGVCASPGGEPSCSFAPVDVDCAASGQLCQNGACVAPVVGFCRTQFPTAITDTAGTSHTVYGHVYVAGITDQTDTVDVDPRIVAQVGYGAATADPATWTWTASVANPSYDPTAPAYEVNNDEYQGTLVVPSSPGSSLGFAYRFSADGGTSWTYCDADNAGSTDGFTALGALQVVAPYFSEYVEGSSNNKALEIFNPGTTPFSLSGCAISVYFNGATSATFTAPLPDTSIAPGDVFVYCHGSYALADVAQCDLLSLTSAFLWNGDDAIELKCDTTTLDVIGQIGSDPGAEWGSGAESTADNTLLRQCTVTTGDRAGGDEFTPSAEWKGYAQNATHLGTRDCPLP